MANTSPRRTAAEKRELKRLKVEEEASPTALFADVIRIVRKTPEGPADALKGRRATTRRR